MATGTANVEKHSTLVQTHQHVPDITHHYTRQIQALRYVNWILTSPLLFTNMALLSGLPGGNLLPAISADLITFAAGLLGTFATRPTMTWVWYSGACAAYLVTAYQLAIHGNRAAGHKDAQTRRFYGALVIVLLLAKGIYLVYVPFPIVPSRFFLGEVW